jgi:hypothetical protein
MNQSYMGGKVDVSLNGITIPARYLSDDGVVTTFTEGTREIATMDGTITQSSGTFDEATVVFTVVLPNMYYLGNIFPEQFEQSNDRPTVAGRTSFGGDDCTVRANTPLVVHYSCEPNSDNDIFVPNASIQATFELTQNVTDPVTVEITANAQPDDNGLRAWFGTGSLDEPTIWDPVSGQYVPVTS